MKTRTVGVRLTPVLEQRLEELCAVAQRRPSVVLRALVATATIDNLPRAWQEASMEEKTLLAEIDTW
jgi:predicted transcriptional regulator